MRFDSSSSTPPVAPSWRMILWAMTLLPALLILGWSLSQPRSPKPDVAAVGITADEAKRLKQILNAPSEDAASRLQGDTVRVASPTSKIGASQSFKPPVSDDIRLDKSILAAIKDNTFGVTAAEKPAYDAILAKVRSVTLADLEPLANKDVPFATLMLDADRYRGEILTLEGDVRRLNRLTENSTEQPASDSFEAWLFTADSGLHPYRLVLASVPDGIPFGDDLKPPVRGRVTGYFFKRYSYATANDFHTAPLVLAKTLTPFVSQKSVVAPSTKNSRSLTFLAIGILVTLVVGGVAVEMIVRRRLRRARRKDPSEELHDTRPDFSWLKRP